MNISYIKSPPNIFLKFLYSVFFFFPMNSVHEQCPNNDPKQCTISKLGWVHSAHTQNPGRAHTTLAVPMLWALLHAQQACRAHVARAQPAQVARMLGVHLSRHAQAACPQVTSSLRCRDIKAMSIMSRHQIGVPTPSRPLHVATSFLCPHRYPCRDIKMMSRHQA